MVLSQSWPIKTMITRMISFSLKAVINVSLWNMFCVILKLKKIQNILGNYSVDGCFNQLENFSVYLNHQVINFKSLEKYLIMWMQSRHVVVWFCLTQQNWCSFNQVSTLHSQFESEILLLRICHSLVYLLVFFDQWNVTHLYILWILLW